MVKSYVNDLVVFEYPVGDSSAYLPLIARFEERGTSFITLLPGVCVVDRDEAGYGIEYTTLPTLKSRGLAYFAGKFSTYFTNHPEFRVYLEKSGAQACMRAAESGRYLLLAESLAVPEWLLAEDVSFVSLVDGAFVISVPEPRESEAFPQSFIERLASAGAAFALLPLVEAFTTRVDWAA